MTTRDLATLRGLMGILISKLAGGVGSTPCIPVTGIVPQLRSIQMSAQSVVEPPSVLLVAGRPILRKGEGKGTPTRRTPYLYGRVIR